MTSELLTAVFERILQDEGGLSDHPADRGGLTNFGLTKPFLHAVTGREWSDEDIRSLSKERALAVYRLWAQIRRLDQLPEHFPLAWVVMDFAVHSGHRAAIRATQRELGIPDDGIAGPETQGGWQLMSGPEQKRMAGAVIARRLEFIGSWLQQPGQAVFARGVLRRIGAQVKAVATA